MAAFGPSLPPTGDRTIGATHAPQSASQGFALRTAMTAPAEALSLCPDERASPPALRRRPPWTKRERARRSGRHFPFRVRGELSPTAAGQPSALSIRRAPIARPTRVEVANRCSVRCSGRDGRPLYGAVYGPFDCGLRNRRSQVRILSGALPESRSCRGFLATGERLEVATAVAIGQH
jgi:hypothetical protein